MQVNILQSLVSNAKNLINQGYYREDRMEGDIDIKLPKFVGAIEKKFLVMGEIKPASPTKGIIYGNDVLDTKIDQIASNVDGVSVMTEPNYFGGQLDNLRKVEKYDKPVLMKDFVIDPTQFFKRNCSAILLINRILPEGLKKYLIDRAHKMGYEIILEVDNENDFVENLETDADILAINNRNLDTMEVDHQRAEKYMIEYQPESPILGFSGYKSTSGIRKAYESGLSGVLLGTILSELNKPHQFLQNIKEELSL